MSRESQLTRVSGPLHAVLARLPDAKPIGGQWSARCPAHEDQHPSLSIALADDGGVLLHCFGGCPRACIVEGLGFQERDLRPERGGVSVRTIDRRHRERQAQAHAEAAAVLAHPDPIVLVEAELAAQGYGGHLRVPLLAYLAATTRLLAPRLGSMPAHLLFIGPSSSGKNAAMQAALRLLPDDDVHVIDAGSPRVLIYDEAPLDHRVVVFGEADSLPAGEDNPAASAIRNLLQDGRLHYQVTLPDPATGRYRVHKVAKPGPTVLMTTSTRRLGHQLMTRLFTVEIPDEPGHVRAALAAQAALELDDPPPPNEGLVAYQRYLGSRAPIDVVVPFARELQSCLGSQPGGPRVLRDFPRLLSLIRAVTVLRIVRRSANRRGQLEAEIDDYRVVFDLLADSYDASAGASARIRDAVAAVAELIAAKGAGATVSVIEVAARLGVSESSAWRRVQDAVGGKWLVNDEPRRWQTAKLRLGEPLPASAGLPNPDAIRELHLRDGARLGSRVFTLAPDTAAPPRLADIVRDGDGADSSVNAANVQTVELDRQPPPPPVPLNFGIFIDDDEEWGSGIA